MNIRQNIYNESDNFSSKVISVRYVVEPDANSKWNHRDIEYNGAGTPILKLYIGETKKVYKKVYINGVESNVELIKDSVEQIELENITYTSTTDYVEICGNNIGRDVISNQHSGEITNTYTIINNPELIVIVEKEPEIIAIKWGHENPLILNSKTSVDISLIVTMSNNQDFVFDINKTSDLKFLSSNPHVVQIKDYRIHPQIVDAKCHIKISDASVLRIFGENIKNIEPLMIVIYETVSPDLLISATFSVDHEKTIPTLNIGSTHVIKINTKYELMNGEILEYEINNVYSFESTNNNVSIIDSNNSVVTAKGVGNSQIKATCIDYDNDFLVIPDKLYWDVHVIRNISKIECSISNSKLNIGLDIGILKILVTYDDDEIEDISTSCSYKYDEKLINISGNEVIPILPGTTTISPLVYIDDGLIHTGDIAIEVISPIRKMWLNNYELDLIIGENHQLELFYKPDNATPKELEWFSTDSDVVTVNDNGLITAVNRGTADVIICEKLTDETLSSVNIYLPENLNIETVTDGTGCAEIKLLDSTLYSIKLLNENDHAISNAKIIYSNTSEQQLVITLTRKNAIEYDKYITVEITNFYGLKVRGMPITLYMLDDDENILDRLRVKTNKQGVAQIQSLTKTYTDENGLAIIDGMDVQINYIGLGLSNVIVNHDSYDELSINIMKKLELESMKKLAVTVFKHDDNNKTKKPIDNVIIKIYIDDELCFNDYATNGYIELDEITSLIDLKEITTFDEINEDHADNLLIYNPTMCAVCKVNCNAINATDISFKQNKYTLDIDDDPIEVDVIVKPNEATFKDYTLIIEDTNVAKLNSANKLHGYKVGNTKLKVVLNDDKSIYNEIPVEITSHRIQSIIIDGGNDTDYEWYDDLNKIKVFNNNGEYLTEGKAVTTERYDDDDFARYYLPVNNSMQLKALIKPSDAFDTNLKWLSSDSNLVKVNDNGIITAIRRGKQELDVYGDDDTSETRFANTVWITALNTRYKKYAVCQVRVTRNKVLGIDIPIPNEHDIDIDDINSSGRYDSKSEHEFDYIMHVGDTIRIPVALTTQDAKFGTSDLITWLGSYHDILELSNISPNHSNAKNLKFDWNSITPDEVNKSKNNYNLEVTAINIGDTSFYAQAYDNVRSVTKKQLYVPDEAVIVDIPETGIATVNANGIGKIRIDWFSKISTILSERKEMLRKEYSAASIDRTIKYQGVTIYDNGVDLIDNVINDTYIATNGVPIVGARCIINPNGAIKIIIPESCKIKNLKTTINNESVPVSFTYNPTIDKTVSFITTSDGREILNTESADEYIQVTLYNVDSSKKMVPIVIDTPVQNGEINKRESYIASAYIEVNQEDDGNISTSYFPTSNKVNGDLYMDDGNSFDARPGTGVWVDGPKSRKVKIRVVATPSKLNIGWINVYDNEFKSFLEIKGGNAKRNKWDEDEYHYMAIMYDEDFKELLDDANIRKEELAEKYKAFAWFSDNESVIRFEDVEDLAYKTIDGKNTSNPMENYQPVITSPVKVHFKNIDSTRYDGYRNISPIADAKFGENYSGSFEDDISVNNTSLCIVKLTAPANGRFCIHHSGSIQYAYNESFTGAKTLTVDTGFHDSFIGAARGDVIYVRGAKTAMVYIKALYFYENNIGPGFWGIQALCDKSPSEYVAYKDMFYLKLPGDNAKWYSSDDGVILYDESTCIRFTPECEANMTITFSSHNIKIKNSRTGSVSEIGKSQSPYTFKVEKNSTYTIFGTNTNDGSIVSSIEYTNIVEGTFTGSYKGTNNFTVKPSFIKRVVCEGKGTAKIYVLSPKGQAVISKTITIN